MNENSPANYNPKDRIKKHLKRKSSSRCLGAAFEAAQSSQAKTFPDIETESCPVPSTSNPFKVGSPLKKRRPVQHVNFADSIFDSEENAQDPFSDNVVNFSQMKDQKTPTKSPRKSPRKKNSASKRPHFERYRSFDPNSLFKECYATDFSQLSNPSRKSDKPDVEELEESESLPLDLRIGTKLRITSTTPFPWMKSRKTTGIVAVRLPASDRYEGLKFFNELFMNGKENKSIPRPSLSLAILEAATMYWQFPVVPGMSLYPRITTHIGTVERIPMSPIATTAMFNQWVESFEQLFHSYKKGDRESFYVACAVFNVLFTKTFDNSENDGNEDSQSCFRTSSGQKMIAIVSHTTSIVREHLRSQGVDYEVIGRTMKRMNSSMNLDETSNLTTGFDSAENSLLATMDEKENSNCMDKDTPEVKKENDSESDENESPTKANQKWLNDIGVSPRNVIRAHVSRKLSSRIAEKGDGILCLLVKGASVQSLYNTLMSSDIVHEKTGPYTKIPPTLIANTSFLYGQLLSLNKTSHIVQKAGKKETEYVLELDRGPVLSHASSLIVDFLRSTKSCTAETPAIIRATDRHYNNGMNGWTDQAIDWNSINIYSDTMKWSKSSK